MQEALVSVAFSINVEFMRVGRGCGWNLGCSGIRTVTEHSRGHWRTVHHLISSHLPVVVSLRRVSVFPILPSVFSLRISRFFGPVFLPFFDPLFFPSSDVSSSLVVFPSSLFSLSRCFFPLQCFSLCCSLHPPFFSLPLFFFFFFVVSPPLFPPPFPPPFTPFLLFLPLPPSPLSPTFFCPSLNQTRNQIKGAEATEPSR